MDPGLWSAAFRKPDGSMFHRHLSIQHALTFFLFLSGATAVGQAQPARIGQVARQVEALRHARVMFTPVTLVVRVGQDAKTEAR